LQRFVERWIARIGKGTILLDDAGLGGTRDLASSNRRLLCA